MADTTAETIISEYVLDASKYITGADQVIAKNIQLISSFDAVTAAYNRMKDAIASGAVAGAILSGGFSGTSGAGSPGGGRWINPSGVSIPTGSWLTPNANQYGAPIGPPVAPPGTGANSGWTSGAPPIWGQGFGPTYGGPVPPVVGGAPSPRGPGGGGVGEFAEFYLAMRGFRELIDLAEEFGRIAIKVSAEALQEFASFDTLQKSFLGLYKSADLAAQATDYLRRSAQTSAFQFRDIADTMRGLVFAGLDVNRFMPIVQGFALAKGDISGSGLNDFLGILRRLQGGNTGLALGPRGIGRYGVSRQELEQYGATFDDKGHFTGSINQAFDAIEGVFKARIKGVADSVKQSFEVSISNAKDAVQQAAIDFGDGLSQNLTDPLKALTDVVFTMRSAGVIKQFGETISAILTGGLNFGRPSPFSYTDDPTLSAEENARRRKAKATDYVRNRFDYGEDAQGRLGPRSAGDPVADVLISIGRGIVELVKWAEAEVEGIAVVVQLLKMMNPFFTTAIGFDFGRATSGAAAAGENFEREARWRMYHQALQDTINPPGAPAAPPTPEIQGQDDDFVEANKHLKDISKHTRTIADHFDSKKTAFGGGDIGRYGVTPVEMSDYYGGHTSRTGNLERSFSAFGGDIQRKIDKMIHDAFMNGHRMGYYQARGN